MIEPESMVVEKTSCEENERVVTHASENPRSSTVLILPCRYKGSDTLIPYF